MKETLDKISQENAKGSALIKTIFKASQLGLIAGSMVTEGVINRNYNARLLRNNKIIWEGYINSIKREKEDVKEVQKGLECGIILKNCKDIQEGDIIQVFDITYINQDI